MTAPFSDNPAGSANRILPRYLFEARIRIRAQRDGKNTVIDGWARDISESGLGAFVARELTVGELVTLEIPLGPTGELMIPAKVARCSGTQYGFQFTALSADQRARIRLAVEGHVSIRCPGPPAEGL